MMAIDGTATFPRQPYWRRNWPQGVARTHGGTTLTTASPAFISYSLSGLDVTTYVPLAAISAAPGDSVSIYGPNGVIWSATLDSLPIGDLYWAELPPQTSTPDEETPITFWVHNSGTGSSSVFFPDAVAYLDGPSIGSAISGTLGNNGWYTSDVTVSWTITDPTGQPITSEQGCDPSSVTADTLESTLTCVATTEAGTNSASVAIKRDTSAPSISVTTPAAGAHYKFGAAVAPNFACNDATSGVATCVGSTIDTSSPGTYSFAADSTDNAGNAAHVAVTYTVDSAQDTTPPLIVAQVVGTAGDNGWYRSDVAVTWQVSDPESGITSSSGCGTSTVANDTNGVTFTCTATSAGGTASRSVTIKRDASAPLIAGSAAERRRVEKGTRDCALRLP